MTAPGVTGGPGDVLAVMDDQIGVIYPNRSPEDAIWHARVVAARAAVAEQQNILRRLVEWNHNVNGDGSELSELLALAEAQVGRGDCAGERRHDMAEIPAVAELIEADREFDAARLSGSAIRIGEAAARRAAALARVSGGAA